MVSKQIDAALNKAAKKVAGTLTAIVETAAEELRTATAAVEASASQMKAMSMSYRDALQSSPPSSAAGVATMDMRVRAREGIQSRQVLIDARAQSQGIHPGESNPELVAAVNSALCDMDDPPGHKFISTRQLNNGGVLLELDSEEAAGWLGSLVTKASFLGHFALEAVIKERSFPLVVQFVPLYFKPEKESDLHQVEADNNLPTGSFLQVRWIKPVHRWAVGQTCGHVMAVLDKPNVANKILTGGLIVCQK